ncbi:hypothetical protein [Shewanella sedimentimangrovi]|uniref:Uncharacterized protein n=1 Tax=Shewanella sedimentimangrovi TaxID=2814293 RepID=A0ABX7R0E4_9GAMM|nr:hypothetical protein [Shewanella sedimentimangrovi]QSX37233.1 hypothetical protein JYB85_18655 [Shewanella sedimentimangrovi]
MNKYSIKSIIFTAGLVFTSVNANANANANDSFGFDLAGHGNVTTHLVADVGRELSNQLEASLARIAAETRLAISLELQSAEVDAPREQANSSLLSQRN